MLCPGTQTTLTLGVKNVTASADWKEVPADIQAYFSSLAIVACLPVGNGTKETILSLEGAPPLVWLFETAKQP